MSIAIPEHLLINWRNWTCAERASEAAADVMRRLELATQNWGIEDLAVLQGGMVALVCSGRRDRREVILKVNPRFRGGKDEAVTFEWRALEAWGGSGLVPQVLGVADGGYTSFLERVFPGTLLHDEVSAIEERLEILGDLALQLRSCVDALPDVPSFHDSEMFEEWARALADAGLEDELAELESLARDETPQVLIHGDLHGKNVLTSGRGWCVIDPKPCIGDPHFEHFAPLYLGIEPPRGAAGLSLVTRWVERYAQAAQLDETRLAAIVRLRATALTAWSKANEPESDWFLYLEHVAEALR